MKFFHNKADLTLIKKLLLENRRLKHRIGVLENLCETKDGFFKELMADGLRHGSALAAKHMAERKGFLNTTH